MELITENRYRMKEALLEIEPIKIMSFTQIDINELFDKEIQVIINTQFLSRQKKNKWHIRTNNKIHAKIAIGRKGVIFGSWNFSDNSTFMMHEIITKFDRYDSNGIWELLNKYFEDIWDRSTEVK